MLTGENMSNTHQLQNHISLKIIDTKTNKIKLVNVYAGSCLNPSAEALENANFFVGLDNIVLTDRENFVPLHRLFHIDDNSVPQDVEAFKELVHEICTLMQEGKIPHVGCIGGKGRTGLVLSAIVQFFKSDILSKMNVSAIDYVRLVYSEEAIENEEQEKFLQEHFNISTPLQRI